MPVTVDSNTTYDVELEMPTAGFDRFAQAFACSTASKKLTTATFKMRRASGSSVGRTAVAKLYSIGTGTFGTDAKPNNSQAPLATSDAFDLTALSGAAVGDFDFTFSGANQYVMAVGHYIISIEYGTGDNSNSIGVEYNGSDVHSGNLIIGNISGDSWAATSPNDMYFIVSGELADVTVNLTGVTASPTLGTGMVTTYGLVVSHATEGITIRRPRKAKAPEPRPVYVPPPPRPVTITTQGVGADVMIGQVMLYTSTFVVAPPYDFKPISARAFFNVSFDGESASTTTAIGNGAFHINAELFDEELAALLDSL